MIHRGFIYGLWLITVNLVLAKGTVLTPLKIESSPLHVYKTGLDNEFDYLLKRSGGSQNVDESPDSKERRSQMGSSFIRFGRNHHPGSLESPDDSANNLNNINLPSSRTPRGRSDVIIRFGRAGLSNSLDFSPLSSLDRGIITIPLNLPKLAAICPNILTTNEPALHNDLLVRLCTSLTPQSADIDNNY